MIKHRIGVVTYVGLQHAWVLDLPGCVVGGEDLGAIESMLPLVMAEHEAWVRAHGGVVEESGAWDIVETVDARDGRDFCFEAERTPPSREELAQAIERMGYARADLLDAVRALPDAVQDWEPPSSAFASFDPWAPGVRTIRALLRHVLQLETYYRTGLHDGRAQGIFERVGTPEEERARTIALLESLSDDERARTFHPLRPGQSVPEQWTVRKALRRIISHERVHAAEIVQRHTWLLLGMPEAAQR